MNKGKIIAISISEKKGIPKTNIQEAELIENWGIVGDIHAGKWHRQISLLTSESIKKINDTGLIFVEPGNFAENITTELLDFTNIKIGSKLKLGGNILLEITQIGKECHARCAIYHTVGDCVMPSEGIFAKVLIGGKLKINDEIEIME